MTADDASSPRDDRDAADATCPRTGARVDARLLDRDLGVAVCYDDERLARSTMIVRT